MHLILDLDIISNSANVTLRAYEMIGISISSSRLLHLSNLVHGNMPLICLKDAARGHVRLCLVHVLTLAVSPRVHCVVHIRVNWVLIRRVNVSATDWSQRAILNMDTADDWLLKHTTTNGTDSIMMSVGQAQGFPIATRLGNFDREIMQLACLDRVLHSGTELRRCEGWRLVKVSSLVDLWEG